MCLCVFNSIALLCETATCQMADMLNELKFGISGPHNLLIDEVISISLSTLECQGDPAESFFAHTKEVFSWDLLINTQTQKITCSSSMFQRQKSPQHCGCPL